MCAAPSPQVAVVTPVYNGERYLARCIESVLAQTYPHWEYSVVNNCSTDATRAIAQAYAATHPQLRVHNSDTFSSCERSHNLALQRISRGCKYVKMVFADDWLYPECLERMVELAERHPSIGIVGAYGLRGSRLAWDGLPPDRSVFSGHEICRARLLGGEYVFGTPTSLLIRADLVRGREHFYNEDNEHSDTEACYDLLRDSDFGFVHQVLTYTHEEAGSLTEASSRRNSYLPGALYDLVKYGPSFLTSEELAGAVQFRLRLYYDFLARSALRRAGSEFWQFHLERLRTLGHPLSRARLMVRIAALLLDSALNPKRTFENALRSRSAGRGH